MGNKYSGFATMGKDERRKIAAAGGKAAHAQGRAHQFTQEEARAAGKKGGEARSAKRKSAQSSAKDGIGGA